MVTPFYRSWIGTVTRILQILHVQIYLFNYSKYIHAWVQTCSKNGRRTIDKYIYNANKDDVGTEEHEYGCTKCYPKVVSKPLKSACLYELFGKHMLINKKQ